MCRAAAAPATPQKGIFGDYSRGLDPWQQWRYDDHPVPTRDWLRRSYTMLTRWLKEGGGPTYRLGSIALWSLCSWDAVSDRRPAAWRAEPWPLRRRPAWLLARRPLRSSAGLADGLGVQACPCAA
jgi:hypothetical protein